MCSFSASNTSAQDASGPVSSAAPPCRWFAPDYGVVPDGKTDNTQALQAVLDLAGKARGGIVELPVGEYRLDGTLRIPGGVCLQGTYRVPPTVGLTQTSDHPQAPPLDGTVLLAYAGRNAPESPAFIRLAGSNSAIAGIVIRYPEWDMKTIPPIPYPPCIESTDTDNVGISECCLVNPYEGIRLVRAARHLVRNITGYPIWRGIYVDQCYDIGRIENIHYWPFGYIYRAKDPYCEWINKNGTAFELARTDWEYVHNTFCFGYGVGYKFSETRRGSANGNFLGLGADSCRRAVLVEQSQEPGLLITNGEFVGRWTSDDSICLEIAEGNRGKVSLSNCSFWGPIDRCIVSRTMTGQFTANGCHFVNWDNGRTGSPAIEIINGKAIVTACTFQQGGTQVKVHPSARSAILSSNQAEGGFYVEGAELKQVLQTANELSPLDSIVIPDEGLKVHIGSHEDDGFMKHWFDREKTTWANEETTMRWSGTRSNICLPVQANTEYMFTIQLQTNPYLNPKPDQANQTKQSKQLNQTDQTDQDGQAKLSNQAGIWLGDTQLVSFSRKGQKNMTDTETKNRFTFYLPASDKTRLTLEVRTPGWVPAEVNKGSNDYRKLGVSALWFEIKPTNTSK